MLDLGLIDFAVIIVLTVSVGVLLIAFFWAVRARWEHLPLFVVLFVISALLTACFTAIEKDVQERRRHTTQTAQEAISHFINDVHGGQLESDLWTLNSCTESLTLSERYAARYARYTTSLTLTETTWMEIFVWLTLREYDITHDQIRRELEGGRISIERYVNISGLRETQAKKVDKNYVALYN